MPANTLLIGLYTGIDLFGCCLTYGSNRLPYKEASTAQEGPYRCKYNWLIARNPLRHKDVSVSDTNS